MEVQKGVFLTVGHLDKQTVWHVVRNSSAGLDSSEIGRLVGLLPRSFMAQLRKIQGLRQDKYEKRFVYYSDEEHTYCIQRSLRSEESKKMPKKLPSDAEAIFILVDRIKHSGPSVEQCAQRLRKKGKSVSIVDVQNLLAYHDIEKNAGYFLVRALTEHLYQLAGNISLKTLFRSIPTIPFVPLIERCLHCAYVGKAKTGLGRC